MNNLLITGGNGLLGAYLVRWFAQQGQSRITATYQSHPDTIPPDIRTAATWKKLVLPDKARALELVEGHQHVIHAAGYVSYRAKDKYRLLDINQTGTEHIVNACLAHNAAHLIYIGSIGALGREKSPATIDESTPWLDNEFSTGYGLSKYLGELEVWRGAAEGLPVSVVLPSVILGSGDLQRSSMKLIDRILHKAPYYPGGQTGFVDVRDVVQFTARLLDQEASGQRWIVNGSNVRYGDLYQRLAGHLGVRRTFREAPKWLAHLILTAGSLMGKQGLGKEALNQAYGVFTYDAAKSRGLEGFAYRDLDLTLAEVARAYHQRAHHAFLSF